MRYTMLVLLAGLVFFGPAMADDKKAGHEAGHQCSETCPEKGHEVVNTVADVTVTGKVLCNHCDLHRGDHCQKVLVTEDKKIYQFCPETVKSDELSKLSGKQVEVKGTVKELKDADSVLHVATIKPVS